VAKHTHHREEGDEEKLQQENILAENDFIYALKVRGKMRWMDLYSCSLRMERKEISLSSLFYSSIDHSVEQKGLKIYHMHSAGVYQVGNH